MAACRDAVCRDSGTGCERSITCGDREAEAGSRHQVPPGVGTGGGAEERGKEEAGSPFRWTFSDPDSVIVNTISAPLSITVQTRAPLRHLCAT